MVASGLCVGNLESVMNNCMDTFLVEAQLCGGCVVCLCGDTDLPSSSVVMVQSYSTIGLKAPIIFHIIFMP